MDVWMARIKKNQIKRIYHSGITFITCLLTAAYEQTKCTRTVNSFKKRVHRKRRPRCSQFPPVCTIRNLYPYLKLHMVTKNHELEKMQRAQLYEVKLKEQFLETFSSLFFVKQHH